MSSFGIFLAEIDKQTFSGTPAGSDWLFRFSSCGLLQMATGHLEEPDFFTDYLTHVLLSGRSDSFSK